jgi:hypothetical protein
VRISDYFAELFVAGLLADAGWNVYFPHRDQGFDFIITKRISTDDLLIRPVQVKGKYPMEETNDRDLYGYIGPLELHPEMVLAIPFFVGSERTPLHIAYMPAGMIRPHSKGYRCLPALLKQGRPHPRRDHRVFFDYLGLNNLDLPEFKNLQIADATNA